MRKLFIVLKSVTIIGSKSVTVRRLTGMVQVYFGYYSTLVSSTKTYKEGKKDRRLWRTSATTPLERLEEDQDCKNRWVLNKKGAYLRRFKLNRSQKKIVKTQFSPQVSSGDHWGSSWLSSSFPWTVRVIRGTIERHWPQFPLKRESKLEVSKRKTRSLNKLVKNDLTLEPNLT